MPPVFKPAKTDMTVSVTFECCECDAEFTATVPLVVTKLMTLAITPDLRTHLPDGWRMGQFTPGILQTPGEPEHGRNPFFILACPTHAKKAKR